MNSDPIGRIGHPWQGLALVNGRGNRSPSNLHAVIAQFSVGTHGRYKARDINQDGKIDTTCNLFLWDWSIAMSAEIPHWVDASGNPAQPYAAGARELNARNTILWLRSNRLGWVRSNEAEARTHALKGFPTAVTWENLNPGKPSHVAVVRASTDKVARIAQAGGSNFEDGPITKGFGNASPLEWWIHE